MTSIPPESERANLARSLSDTDLDLVRALEDLIHVLIGKEVIHMSDLPEAVQRKLQERQELRARLGDLLESQDADDGLMLP